MATYSVQAPNGKTYSIDGPDGASDAQVQAQILQQHPEAGGTAAPAPTPAPAAPAGPATVQNGFGLGAPPGPKGTPARAAYDAEYNKRFNAAYTAAHPTPAQKAQQAGQELSNNSGASDLGQGLLSGLRQGTFGLADRAAAAAETYLPSWLTGNNSNASYSDVLNTIRARDAAEANRSTTGNIIGQLSSGVGVGKLAAAGASKVVGAFAPAAGNYLSKLLMTQKGQPLANAARISGVGAAAGAADAAGNDKDIATGALTGAVAAPVLHAGAGAVSKFLVQPVATALRLPSAQAILRQFTGATADEIAQNAADFRAKTGAEPTIFEVLPLQDREAVKKLMQRMPAGARDQAAAAVRDRAAAIGPEMAQHVSETMDVPIGNIQSGIASDLANSKGAPSPTPEDAQAAGAAVAAPVDMKTLQATEASNIMAPHDDTVVTDKISDLYPQAPVAEGRVSKVNPLAAAAKQELPGAEGIDPDVARAAIDKLAPPPPPGRPTISFQETDPEVSALISNVAGPRKLGENITVSDITGMISKLKALAPNAGIQQPAVARAITHLEEQLPPGAREAYDQMTQAFAGRGRMLEGVTEGARTRLRGNIPVETKGQRLDVTNAYDTPEGTQGRTIGQTAQLQRNFTADPTSSLAATSDIAGNPATQQALGANLGLKPASAIATAAETQAESARRLSGLSNEVSAHGTTDNMTLAHALITLNPKSMLMSKANALSRLSQIFAGLPEKQSRQIVEALFSRNPTAISRGMGMLNNMGDAGKAAISTLAHAVTTGGLAAQVGGNFGEQSNAPIPPDTLPPISPVLPPPDGSTTDNSAPAPDAAAPSGEPANPAGYSGEPGSLPTTTDHGNLPYGHAVISALFPGAHVTQDVRDPNSALGRKNPGSFHVRSQNATDVRPIPGLTFNEFIQQIHSAGYEILEARDEVHHPIPGLTTGPHWHVVIAGKA